MTARGFGLGSALLLLVTVTSCGNEVYAVKAASAESKLQRARELGAEEYAPYEYFYAEEHLEKARGEAAEADYGDAIDLVEASGVYADKAAERSRGARRRTGR